ncbi:hypothetical protein U9M48_044827 [Paspalum notatum var. saurae]|uniref:KIB1-4 beta-propeller domain-containing protein n=1 Tax=Paspalum notatum var. saurae TaxID=547442 RepID=A0AAQ3V1V8_PASNO
MGAEKAVDPLSSADKMVYPDADDILFYNDELHCINRGEDLFVWSPTNLPNGDLKLDNLDDWRHFFVDYELDHALSRYFVESQGQLLLVVKYGTDTDRSRPVTRRFRVYRLTVPKFDVTQRGPVTCPCVEEPDLDGRMLFVGRGCSRSFEDQARASISWMTGAFVPLIIRHSMTQMSSTMTMEDGWKGRRPSSDATNRRPQICALLRPGFFPETAEYHDEQAGAMEEALGVLRQSEHPSVVVCMISLEV